MVPSTANMGATREPTPKSKFPPESYPLNPSESLLGEKVPKCPKKYGWPNCACRGGGAYTPRDGGGDAYPSELPPRGPRSYRSYSAAAAVAAVAAIINPARIHA